MDYGGASGEESFDGEGNSSKEAASCRLGKRSIAKLIRLFENDRAACSKSREGSTRILIIRKGQGSDRVRAWSQTDRAIIGGLEHVYVAEQRDEGVESVRHPRKISLSQVGLGANGRFDAVVTQHEPKALGVAVKSRKSHTDVLREDEVGEDVLQQGSD